MLAPAALASGPTYCVGVASCPGESVGEAGNGEQLQAALEKAAKAPESTLLIGEGTYSRAGGFKYEGGPVTIRGAAEGGTVLTDDAAGGSTVLTVKTTEAKAVAAVSQLLVKVPKGGEGSGKGEEQTGLFLGSGAQLEHVNVVGGGGNQDVGVSILKGASFTAGAIQMSETEGEAVGVYAFGGRLSSCVIVGAYGLAPVRSEEVVLRGCAIEASKVGVDVGIESPGSGKLLAEDALVVVDQPEATGVLVRAGQEQTAAATLRGLTIIGGKLGLKVEAATEKGTSTAATAVLESTVIAEATQSAYDVFASAEPIHLGHKATARLLARYSDLVGGEEEGSSGDGEPIFEPEGTMAESPQFVGGTGGILGGEWRPAAGSPLIDAGVPGPLAEGELETDLEGEPRIVHGRRDIGAFEYQFRPPTVVTATATPGTALTGHSVSFSGSATTSEPGDSVVSYQWTFDDGASVPAGASATHAFTTPGVHTATLTATDAAGVQAAKTVQVQVFAPQVVCNVAPCNGCGGSPLKCFLATPQLTALRLHPNRFRPLHRGASVLAPSAHGGTVVTLTLTRKANVTFTPERVAAGVLHGGRCVAAGHGVHGHRCTRLVALRSFTHGEPAGTDTLRFSGRVAGHALPPGRYELMVSVPQSSLTTPFTIIK
jgi:hypothetical protein